MTLIWQTQFSHFCGLPNVWTELVTDLHFSDGTVSFRENITYSILSWAFSKDKVRLEDQSKLKYILPHRHSFVDI